MRKLGFITILFTLFISACTSMSIDDEMTPYLNKLFHQLEVNGYVEYEVSEAKWFIFESENNIYGKNRTIHFFLILSTEENSVKTIKHLYYYNVSGLDESGNQVSTLEENFSNKSIEDYNDFYDVLIQDFSNIEVNVNLYNQVLGEYIIFNKSIKKYSSDEIKKIFT
jgi:hypothetical protein